MKMKSIFLSMMGLTAILCACNKENAPQPQSSSEPNYSQLRVGNYWIYEQYQIQDSDSSETLLNTYDSCYVVKDTVIRNNRYYKMYKPDGFSDYVYLRDSLDYIINEQGYKIFSSKDFTNNLFSTVSYDLNNDTMVYIWIKMTDRNFTTNVAAGSFTTICAKKTIKFVYEKYMTTRYAKNVGIVTETLLAYASATTHTERRLIRYRVQ